MARASTLGAVAGWFRKYAFAPRYRRAVRERFVTDDGVRLAAHRLDGPPGAPVAVVVLHGFVNWSRTPAIVRFAEQLRAEVAVLVPDLRGHGRSGGASTLGALEPLDVRAAVAAARRAWPHLPVVTLGVSLGGAAALVHAGTDGGVAGVVAVSAPAEWRDPELPGAHRVAGILTSRPIRLFLAVFCRTRIGRARPGFSDGPRVVGAIAPAFTLVVHDPADWYFGPEHAEALHAWARPPKALWWEHEDGHGTDLLTADFGRRLLGELRARFGPGSPGTPAVAAGRR